MITALKSARFQGIASKAASMGITEYSFLLLRHDIWKKNSVKPWNHLNLSTFNALILTKKVSAESAF